jgi:hypothetical protein
MITQLPDPPGVLTGASAARVDETAAGGVDASALELVAQG